MLKIRDDFCSEYSTLVVVTGTRKKSTSRGAGNHVSRMSPPASISAKVLALDTPVKHKKGGFRDLWVRATDWLVVYHLDTLTRALS